MNSYKRIKSITLSNSILKFLADQRQPVSGQDIARALGAKYGTVMCCLATHIDDQFVELQGDNFRIGQALAHFWARRKAHLESTKTRCEEELKQLEVNDGE